MLKITSNLINEMKKHHLTITHVNQDLTEWGPIDLNITAPTELENLNYDIQDSSPAEKICFEINQNEKVIATNLTNDEAIRKIRNLCKSES